MLTGSVGLVRYIVRTPQGKSPTQGIEIGGKIQNNGRLLMWLNRRGPNFVISELCMLHKRKMFKNDQKDRTFLL